MQMPILTTNCSLASVYVHTSCHSRSVTFWLRWEAWHNVATTCVNVVNFNFWNVQNSTPFPHNLLQHGENVTEREHNKPRRFVDTLCHIMLRCGLVWLYPFPVPFCPNHSVTCWPRRCAPFLTYTVYKFWAGATVWPRASMVSPRCSQRRHDRRRVMPCYRHVVPRYAS